MSKIILYSDISVLFYSTYIQLSLTKALLYLFAQIALLRGMDYTNGDYVSRHLYFEAVQVNCNY